MPILRRVIKVNREGSRAVVLPKSWLKYFEDELGFKIEEVEMEIDKMLTITPHIPKHDEARDRGTICQTKPVKQGTIREKDKS